MDSMWMKLFVHIGREGRSKFEYCYREIAALGRLVKASEEGQEDALEKLEAQRTRVQAAYDEYVRARAAINLEWASYLRTESFLGPEIQALVEKLDAGLPTRIDGFKSPADAAMNASLKAVKQATDVALSRAERQHTIAVWADRVVTAIQLVTAGVTVGRAAVKIFTEVAEQSGKKAAAKAVAKFVAVELATAVASAGVGAVVIPEILAAAGLDPVEVQIGMAAYGAIGLLSTAAVSRPARRWATGKPHHVPPSFKEDRGVWALGDATRGKEIHRRLGENLPDNFPVVDIFDSGIVTSIKSLDLHAATYAKPEKLKTKLTEFVDDIAAFQGKTWANVVIKSEQIKRRVVLVAIPPGFSLRQLEVIHEVVAYGASKGVELKMEIVR